ncbi:MAG: secretin N-terminal domain-containing protein [Planctomycetota bacterium]
MSRQTPKSLHRFFRSAASARLLCALGVALAGLGVEPLGAQAGGQAGQAGVPAIQEQGDDYIINLSEDPTSQVTLEEFIRICKEATGRQFTYNEQTAQQLAQANTFLLGSKRIPKESFYAFFQIMMFINDFVCIEVGPPELAIILIQSVTGNRAGGLKQKAIQVLPDDLERYADQPATLITTVINLEHTDVRALTVAMRGMMTDVNTQSLIPAGESSVILQGFGSYIASLAKLLYIVDEASAIEADVAPVYELIPMEFAAAEDVADLIEQLLEARQRAAQQRGPRQQNAQGVAGQLDTSTDEIKILVYGRQNSLLVMAPPDEMPQIQNLIAQLDVDVIEPERNYHIYSLQNVKAEDIADVLDNFLSDAERLARGQSGTGGRAGANGQAGGAGTSAASTNEVVVVPDENSNSLLIAANKTRYEEILDLLRKLDRRQDQVLIETALIELSGTDFRDIGVEWALADVMGDGGFGATGFGLSTLTDSDGDGVPDLRVPNSTFTGLSAGILSGDDVNIPLLIAAAERNDKANVLNVPSVLVNNNGHAVVTTKDEQPTTTITANNVGGQTQENFNGYEEAGITLHISPSISAANYLRLELSLVVSSFRGSVSGAIPPPRITREITTMVNVPDGYTMVVGGIITDDETKTRQGIPWVAKIPILGALFRRETKTNNQTKLYFFVTPHILRDRDFADLAKLSFERKMDAADQMGADRMRVIDPDFGTRGAIDDFEGFQVPLFEGPDRGELSSEALGLTTQERNALLERGQNYEIETGRVEDGATDEGQVVPETEQELADPADDVGDFDSEILEDDE